VAQPEQSLLPGENSGQKVAFSCAGMLEAGLRFWPFAGKSDIRAAEDQR
jgi:hypothetical protein